MNLNVNTLSKSLLLLAAILLTSCASNNVSSSKLNYLLQTPDMVWLGANLDDEEWGHLHGFVYDDLIPYVSELEVGE